MFGINEGNPGGGRGGGKKASLGEGGEETLFLWGKGGVETGLISNRRGAGGVGGGKTTFTSKRGTFSTRKVWGPFSGRKGKRGVLFFGKRKNRSFSQKTVLEAKEKGKRKKIQIGEKGYIPAKKKEVQQKRPGSLVRPEGGKIALGQR